ncbi:MAG: 3-hydroxyacyl-ACP dehydratase FabZ family protein [Phycisphaerales bacterium]|jgi:3-hydroxyacyl-[acyl-carrier-protein] dehydratase|nr:beta-hydroxyacyl-ACP dehydratase [Phycisphaeraceae bacterium]
MSVSASSTPIVRTPIGPPSLADCAGRAGGCKTARQVLGDRAGPERLPVSPMLERVGIDGLKEPLLDYSAIDIAARPIGRTEIGNYIPHRDQFALLDHIIWDAPTGAQGIAIWNVGMEEFWVKGHFPGMPLLPGVLMVEAGAQLGAYLFNLRWERPKVAAFTRIESCVFRASVQPGDELLILANEVNVNERRFVSDVQGLVRGKVAFGARISGMTLT